MLSRGTKPSALTTGARPLFDLTSLSTPFDSLRPRKISPSASSRTRNVRYGHQQAPRPQHPQVFRRGVGSVAEAFDGRQHLAPGGGSDNRRVREDARDRCDRYARRPGHIVDFRHGESYRIGRDVGSQHEPRRHGELGESWSPCFSCLVVRAALSGLRTRISQRTARCVASRPG